MVNIVKDNIERNRYVIGCLKILPNEVKAQVATLKRVLTLTNLALAKELKVSAKSVSLWNIQYPTNVDIKPITIHRTVTNEPSKCLSTKSVPKGTIYLDDEELLETRRRVKYAISAIPVISTRGDIITEHEQTLMNNWLANNTPRKFVGSTQVN